ncbi:DNA recombination protein RmuC [Olivibacter domesticus]|uniref:DNA recombination protein RmuC n=1 Tax=Olivibacter domesticus TaxID=407022 RepID=A0A1H7S7C4_OLID1|nr:DNA recombination protein RmuC [Olivibacter domesticus]SEL68268.1 DNA recombination protein RmuC [Olivibacter domesticus]
MENLVIVILLLALLFILYNFTKRTNQNNEVIIQDNQQRDELLIKVAKAEQKAESYRLENERLLTAIETERERAAAAERTIESMNAYFESQKDKLEEQKLELSNIKSHFNKEFELIANKILEEKSIKFTDTNHKTINQLLDPLKQNIKNFEEKVEKTYTHEAAERNSLKGVVMQLMEQSKLIKDEAINLTRALKGDQKKQGNWGEVILERVLERSGLIKDSEYRLQVSYNTEDGARMQPDAIIDLPEDKHLVIDAKVSLIAYERWVNTPSEEEKELYAKQHSTSIKNHVTELSRKNYQDLYKINSPDFVLMFMPIESAFSMSITYEPELFSDAWDKRVVIVSPSTLLATLRTIASIWKQERQTRNVLEIAREAGALYDKFVGFTEDMDKVDKQITILARTHEDARKKLETGKGSVISKVEKLKKLGAKASKQIDINLFEDDELIESQPVSRETD